MHLLLQCASFIYLLWSLCFNRSFFLRIILSLRWRYQGFQKKICKQYPECMPRNIELDWILLSSHLFLLSSITFLNKVEVTLSCKRILKDTYTRYLGVTWIQVGFVKVYPWPSPPIVYVGPNFVVPGDDGCLVLAMMVAWYLQVLACI